MDLLRLVSIIIDANCMFLCVIGIFAVHLWTSAMGESGRYVYAIFVTHAVQLFSNLMGLVHKGVPGESMRSILVVSNFVEFASGYVLVFLLTLYIFSRIDMPRDSYEKCKIYLYVMLSVSLTLLIISQFTGLYYIIDDNNFYRRQAMFPLSLVPGFINMIFIVAVLYRYRKILSQKFKQIVAIYLFFPILGMVIQPFIYGVYILLWVNTIDLIVVFLVMLSNQNKDYYENKQQLAEAKMDVMLSQIQPHFLYNSLATIDQLIKKDPNKAREAINDFSIFLRCNISSLKRDGMIDFSEEMKHVNAYLALEKMRFEDLLNIEYDIKVDSFMVPPLTIQPLVENAVKHGLCEKEEGGTVRISTEDKSDRYVITVQDDGIGFLSGEIKGDGNHIGINNISARLKTMCNGTLEIESTPRVGTVAVVTIMKEH